MTDVYFSKMIHTEDGGRLLIQRKQGDPTVTLRVVRRDGTSRATSRLQPDSLAELVTALKGADPGIGARTL